MILAVAASSTRTIAIRNASKDFIKSVPQRMIQRASPAISVSKSPMRREG